MRHMHWHIYDYSVNIMHVSAYIYIYIYIYIHTHTAHFAEVGYDSLRRGPADCVGPDPVTGGGPARHRQESDSLGKSG